MARTASSIVFESMNAGFWHNYFPGETRVQLDLAGLVSFYDTQLAPSLVDIRAGQERWDHRVQNVSSENLSAIKSRVETVLSRPTGLSSGIDWRTLVQVIVDRYAQRLELTRHLLNSSTTNPDEIINTAIKVQIQLRIMLTPYLLFMATPTNSSDKADPQWANPIFQLCATTHTHSLESELDSMTDSEHLLLQAVQGTTREICLCNHHQIASRQLKRGFVPLSNRFGIRPCRKQAANPRIMYLASSYRPGNRSKPRRAMNVSRPQQRM